MDFGQKVFLKIVDLFVDFSVDFFLLIFPRKRGRKDPQKKIHRGNQTPKSTSNFRKVVSLNFFTGRLIFIHLQCWEVLPFLTISVPAVYKTLRHRIFIHRWR